MASFQLLIQAMTTLQSPSKPEQIPSSKESYSSSNSSVDEECKTSKVLTAPPPESPKVETYILPPTPPTPPHILHSRVETCILAPTSPQIPPLKTIRFPCKARGMPEDHNFQNAYFIFPEDIEHGEELICSHPQCKFEGVKFRYCGQCAKPVAKRNFRKRHSHNGVPRVLSFKDIPKGWIELYYNRPPDNQGESLQKWIDDVLIESKKGKHKEVAATESTMEDVDDKCDSVMKPEIESVENNNDSHCSPIIKRARADFYPDMPNDTVSVLTLPQFLPSNNSFNYSPIVKKSGSSFVGRRSKPRLFVNTRDLQDEKVNEAVITPTLFDQQEYCSSLANHNKYVLPSYVRTNHSDIFFHSERCQRMKMTPKMITPRS